MTPLLSLLRQRVSAQSFARSEISREELLALVEAACYAPSAFHLQNWHFTAVHSEAAKQELYRAAFCQQKILQAAAVMVISGDLGAYRHLASRLYASVAAGLISEEAVQSWVAAAESAFQNDPQARRDEAIRSASLAAMPLMLAAQERSWATCPMSGFHPDAVRRLAGLPENLLPVLLVAIGKVDGRQIQKVRLPAEAVWRYL